MSGGFARVELPAAPSCGADLAPHIESVLAFLTGLIDVAGILFSIGTAPYAVVLKRILKGLGIAPASALASG